MQKLRDLRKSKGLTTTELGKIIGCSNPTITNYELGNRKPDPETLKKLADFFNVSVDYLLGREEFTKASNIYDAGRILVFEEIGTVRAGFNGIVDEIPTGKKIEIPASMISGGNKNDYFILRVKGDSMYPRLLDGDTILCKRCDSVDNGSLAVVLYNGDEATVKKVHYVSGQNWLELIPINPEYPTKRISGADLEQCRVLGLVVKLIRDI